MDDKERDAGLARWAESVDVDRLLFPREMEIGPIDFSPDDGEDERVFVIRVVSGYPAAHRVRVGIVMQPHHVIAMALRLREMLEKEGHGDELMNAMIERFRASGD